MDAAGFWICMIILISRKCLITLIENLKVCSHVGSQADEGLEWLESLTLTRSRLPITRRHEVVNRWCAHLLNVLPPDFKLRSGNVLKICAVVVTALTVASGTDASAGTASETYQTLKFEQSYLLNRYDAVWNDVDDLQHKIAILRSDRSDESARTVNRLQLQLDDDYRDLKRLEMDVRDSRYLLNNSTTITATCGSWRLTSAILRVASDRSCAGWHSPG